MPILSGRLSALLLAQFMARSGRPAGRGARRASLIADGASATGASGEPSALTASFTLGRAIRWTLVSTPGEALNQRPQRTPPPVSKRARRHY